VAAADAAAQEVVGEEAALVLELGLVEEGGGREGGAEVLGVEEARGRVDLTDRAQGELGGPALLDQHATKGGVVALVRVPQAVEAAEAGGGQGLVDGGVGVDPGVAAGDGARVTGEQGREP